jgi:hypothetical protein
VGAANCSAISPNTWWHTAANVNKPQAVQRQSTNARVLHVTRAAACPATICARNSRLTHAPLLWWVQTAAAPAACH